MKEKYTLTQLRNIKNLTQEGLSQKSGVTSRTIQLYERDIENMRSARYTTLEKLANALDVRVSDIFLDPTSEKPKQIQIKGD